MSISPSWEIEKLIYVKVHKQKHNLIFYPSYTIIYPYNMIYHWYLWYTIYLLDTFLLIIQSSKSPLRVKNYKTGNNGCRPQQQSSLVIRSNTSNLKGLRVHFFFQISHAVAVTSMNSGCVVIMWATWPLYACFVRGTTECCHIYQQAIYKYHPCSQRNGVLNWMWSYNGGTTVHLNDHIVATQVREGAELAKRCGLPIT